MSSEAEDCRLWYPYNPDVLSAVTQPLNRVVCNSTLSTHALLDRHTTVPTTLAECLKSPKGACAYCENSAIEVANTCLGEKSRKQPPQTRVEQAHWLNRLRDTPRPRTKTFIRRTLNEHEK